MFQARQASGASSLVVSEAEEEKESDGSSLQSEKIEDEVDPFEKRKLQLRRQSRVELKRVSVVRKKRKDVAFMCKSIAHTRN